MFKNLARLLLVSGIALCVSDAFAGGHCCRCSAPRFAGANAPMYAYSSSYAPSLSAPANAPPAMSSHVLVPTVSSDGKTPSYAAYSPTFGTFQGWWQLINGIWQFVQSNGTTTGANNGGGGTGLTAAEFQQFRTQYNTDMQQIKTALKIPAGGAGGGAGGGTGGGTGGSGTSDPPPTAPTPQTSSEERLNQISTRLTGLNIRK